MTHYLSVAEVEELLGNATLVFSSYYKYTFTFVGYYNPKEVAGVSYGDEYKIKASWGGNSDDIYRFKIDSQSPVKLCPMKLQGWSNVTVWKRSKDTGWEWLLVFNDEFD